MHRPIRPITYDVRVRYYYYYFLCCFTNEPILRLILTLVFLSDAARILEKFWRSSLQWDAGTDLLIADFGPTNPQKTWVCTKAPEAEQFSLFQSQRCTDFRCRPYFEILCILCGYRCQVCRQGTTHNQTRVTLPVNKRRNTCVHYGSTNPVHPAINCCDRPRLGVMNFIKWVRM